MLGVPETARAGLRFEEAMQAYQYTGPLYQARCGEAGGRGAREGFRAEGMDETRERMSGTGTGREKVEMVEGGGRGGLFCVYASQERESQYRVQRCKSDIMMLRCIEIVRLRDRNGDRDRERGGMCL